jgi:hypothetical protein
MNLRCILKFKPGIQKSQATKFCTVVPNVCGSSEHVINLYSIRHVGVNFIWKEPHTLYIKYAIIVVVTTCSLADTSLCFRDVCCFHHQGIILTFVTRKAWRTKT